VLDGPVPRLIDEWQVEPGLWNHVRRAVDDRGLPGQFVLTGSSVPADDVARHTGAGRFSFLRMRPMTVLATDAGGADGPLGRHTVAEYLTILERLMVIEDQPADSCRLVGLGRSEVTGSSTACR
jgi:hypothetical protein